MYTGDGVDNYIDLEDADQCLQASRAMTIGAFIKPSGLEGTDNYIRRILARDSGSYNYQISVWRNNDWATYNAPVDTASIALWVRVVNNRGGNNWKPVLTDYDLCPIVSDHWYEIRAVWNSDKPGGIPDSPFVPADIFVDDHGTDGFGLLENRAGELNCTNAR